MTAILPMDESCFTRFPSETPYSKLRISHSKAQLRKDAEDFKNNCKSMLFGYLGSVKNDPLALSKNKLARLGSTRNLKAKIFKII